MLCILAEPLHISSGNGGDYCKLTLHTEVEIFKSKCLLTSFKCLLQYKCGLKSLCDDVDDFFTNEMQALQNQWKKCMDCKGSMLKNKPL